MSSQSNPGVILYRYNASPFSVKVDNVLLLKHVHHRIVNVAPALPRPEITELLGVTYRRIPILAIGNDVYCDTSLIISTLERRFPASSGYGTVFPLAKHGGAADTGAVKAFAQFYADTILFRLAPILLPWGNLPPSFIEDRSAFFGSPIDLQAMKASQGPTQSQLSSHMSLMQEQLHDGREWLFDTELPGLADISVHFILAWLRGFHKDEALFDPSKFPDLLKWMDRLSSYLQQKKKTSGLVVTKLSGMEAAAKILSSSSEDKGVVGFDLKEAERLGLKLFDLVHVAPNDTARDYPTKGKLVALNREEIVIEVQASQGSVNCHFPRLGFTAKLANDSKSRL